MGVYCKKGVKRSLVHGRRGQFTLFIIVALVILFVLIFALYARSKVANMKLASQADLQIKDFMSKNAIDQYVTSCLDAVSDDAFILASMQGGLINSTDKIEQADYIVYFDPILNKSFNVSIAIDANSGCPDNRPASDYIVTQVPGLYPYNCRDAYLSELSSRYTNYGNDPCTNNCTDPWSYSGFFGVNALPVLCDYQGSNGPQAGSGKFSTCDYYDYYSDSLQQRLERKITSDIDRCVNFTQVLQRMPSNITMVGNVTTKIIFGREGFSVKLQYPFTVVLLNRQPVTRMVDFSISKDVPFKEIYEYSYELANHDVKDITFGIFDDRTNVISESVRRQGQNIYDQRFKVNIISGNSSNGYINLVQVTDLDASHNIRGHPLMVNFGVKNRRPALDYMHEGSSPLYDIIAVENREILLSPHGIDPDDENILSYNYNGWLEEYSDAYDWANPQCSSPTSLEYVLASCTVPVTSSGILLHNWTQSPLFLETGRNASYNTSHDDIGFHTVKISVADRDSLDDYQLVRILVFDAPLARINGSNLYDDENIDSSHASYEDLYVLNGSESTIGTIGALIPNNRLTAFLWNDTLEPFGKFKPVTNEGDSRVLSLPKDIDADSVPAGYFTDPAAYDIMNIINYTFRKKSDSKDPIIHNISLTVTSSLGISNTNIFYVNVTQCIPHRSSTPSYPYNSAYDGANYPLSLPEELEGNHTCCMDDYTYADKDTECYRAAVYGLERNFIDYKTAYPESPQDLDIVHAGLPSVVEESDNDIFKQEFVRRCTGDRGNICTGYATETRTDVLKCNDDNLIPSHPEFHKEKCSGPAKEFFKKDYAQISLPASCANYDAGTTFESLDPITAQASTGGCTISPQCSDVNEFKAYNPSIIAKYSCDGECSGDGRCNSPVESTCRCDRGCDNSVAIACNGVEHGSSPNQNSCGVGKTYQSDQCVDCGLVDSLNDKRCKSPSSGEGCTADEVCNLRNPRTTGNNIDSASLFVGCNATCNNVECAPYKFSRNANGNNGGCFTTCNQDSDCTSDHFCDLTLNPKKCVKPETIPCTIINGVDSCKTRVGSGYMCTGGMCRAV